jgi:lysophospholipase L1-like esterase
MTPGTSIFRQAMALLLASAMLVVSTPLAAQAAAEPGADPVSLATTPAPLDDPLAVDWWLPRHQEKLAARSKAIRLVMIGDSITHGWENEGKASWGRHFGGIDALNLGFAGDRTENVLWRLQQGEVDGLAPGLVVLMIGTNNTGYRMDPPDAIAAGVQAILEELRTRLPDSHVLLLAIFPRAESAADPQRVNNREANRKLRELAARAGVDFADFNPQFLEPSGRLSPDVMPDLLHPNEAGYEIWATQLQPYVERYVGAE